MVSFEVCTVTRQSHKAVLSRYCPNCSHEVNPPSPPSIKNEEINTIDLTTSSSSNKPRFQSYMANRHIINASRASTFQRTSQPGLQVPPGLPKRVKVQTVKTVAETRPITVIIGPYMGVNTQYKSIGMFFKTHINIY